MSESKHDPRSESNPDPPHPEPLDEPSAEREAESWGPEPAPAEPSPTASQPPAEPSPSVAPPSPADPAYASTENLEPIAPVLAAAPVEHPRRPSSTAGLVTWFGLLVAFGIGALLLGQQELAALVAFTGLFVASQAADHDPDWWLLHAMLTWVVPVGGAFAFGMLALFIQQGSLPPLSRTAVTGICALGAVVSALTLFRPFADALARFLFRTERTSHTLRLSARAVCVLLLFAVPAMLGMRDMIQALLESEQPLVEHLSLGGGLIGYVLLAFAGVGLGIRRDARAALERLGIGPLTSREFLWVALTVLAIAGLNAGADLLQRRLLPELWAADQQVNQTIAAGLSPSAILLLGLSAGIGEEITLRGALQPRLGLVSTAVLFASLHLQYSWYGMVVILLLGMLLGLVRARINTTAAMLAHTLYDIVAVWSLPQVT